MAVPPPAATVEVAAVVTVITNVSTSITSITCSAFNSSAGTPPTAVAPLNDTVSPVFAPCAVRLTVTSTSPSVVAKQLSVSVVVYVARMG